MTDRSKISRDEALPADEKQLLGIDDAQYQPELVVSGNVIRANFNDIQKEEIKQLIEDELSLIKTEYEEIGYFEQIRNCKEKFEAISDENTASQMAGGYDIRIPMQKMIVEILTSRALRQTFQADPVCLMEQEGEIEKDDLIKRENRLDFTLRNEVRYEELCSSIYDNAIVYPVCITKTIECFEESESTRLEEYGPDKIGDYERQFSAQLLDPTSPEYQNKQLLSAGQSVTLPITDTKTEYAGAKVYRIDSEKFFARPKIKDFSKQRVHGDQIDYTWADIDMRANNPKYNWDKDAIERIRTDQGDDYRKNITSFYELIVRYDKNGDGNIRPYVITMEVKTREIVKSILYTQEWSSYTAHSVKPKDDSWIGESLLPMINDLVSVLCSNINYLLYSNDLAHTTVIMTNDPDAMTRREIQLGLVNIIPFAKESTMQAVPLMPAGLDRITVINLIRDFISLLSGIDAQMLSGGETPEDPRAPAAKTAMKMQVTNMRVEDKIIRLQYADAQVFKKVEKIKARTSKNLDWWDKGVKNTIDPAALQVPVRYIVHGSRMSFSRQMDLQLMMQFVEIVSRLDPRILQDDEVIRTLLNSIINDMGGSVKKEKDAILAGLDALIYAKRMAKEIQKAMAGQGETGAQPQPQQENELSAGEGNPSMPQSPGIGGPETSAQPTGGVK